MPQSLSRVAIHLVFSTKERQALIDLPIRPRLHAYLATIGRDLDCETYRVGGTENHVHIAVRLSRTVCQADLVEKLKKTSSAWIKAQGATYRTFQWQAGYGCFSIGWSQMEDLIGYIDAQEEHHKRKTFKQEYLSLLKRYEVAYDEKYLWD